MHRLGDNLARLRQQRGLSVEELARKTGLDASLIRDVESGHTDIGLDEIEIIATALAVKLQSLFLCESQDASCDPCRDLAE